MSTGDARRPRVDLRSPDHPPNLRPDRQPPDPSWLPRQQRGVTPQMIGRYPHYDVFDAQDTWDAATRRVIEERMALHGKPLRFFGDDEEPTLRAFCDVCLAQDAEPRVPVAEFVDDKLAAGRLDGFQYADMGDDRDTWRLVLVGLDESARARRVGEDFAACADVDREAIVDAFSTGDLEGEGWSRLNVPRAWSVCMRMMLTAFYAHPWAWNEIGFGGPAYPRGFMRLGPLGTREPFESRGATSEDPVRVVAEHPEEFPG